MKITIEIDTDNDAFDNPQEVWNVLRRATMAFHPKTVTAPIVAKTHVVSLSDSNGNTCGKMTVEIA